MLHHVRDLSSEQKSAVEALLGQTVSSDEAVSMRAVAPATIIPSQLSPRERAEALRKLDAYFAKTDAGREPLSEEEAIITEAIRSARRGYRPLE